MQRASRDATVDYLSRWHQLWSTEIARGSEPADWPRFCPWRPFRDAFVARVMEAHQWSSRGELALWWGDDDVPNVLIDAVSLYGLELVRSENWQIEEAMREARDDG